MAIRAFNCHFSIFLISGIFARIASMTFKSVFPFSYGSTDWNIPVKKSIASLVIAACSFAFASLAFASFAFLIASAAFSLAFCSFAIASFFACSAISACSFAFAAFSLAFCSFAIASFFACSAISACFFAFAAFSFASFAFLIASAALAAAILSARTAHTAKKVKMMETTIPAAAINFAIRIFSASTDDLILSRCILSMKLIAWITPYSQPAFSDSSSSGIMDGRLRERISFERSNSGRHSDPSPEPGVPERITGTIKSKSLPWEERKYFISSLTQYDDADSGEHKTIR